MSRRPAPKGYRLKQGARPLRIIGGRWRGRRLAFPATEGLRPTPDRVRETVFNWLQPIIEGARCLDLFAGSGALGLEALSRGARELVMVDGSPAATASLRGHLKDLGALSSQVVEADALEYLRGAAMRFDVVFLDPPYGKGLLEPACTLLDRNGWLVADARVYVEAEEGAAFRLPDAWELMREKSTGHVHYGLALAR